jgi:uncharacterized protein (TIGR03000 family)
MTLRSVFFAALTALAAAVFPVTAEAAGGHGGGGHGGGGHGGGFHGGGFHGGGFHGGGYHGGYWGGHSYGHYGYYPRHLGYGWGDYGYGYSPSYDYSWYPNYAQDYSAPTSVYESGYYTPEVTPTAPGVAQDTTMEVTVRVPPDAKVWFDDVRTQKTGSTRQFESPPLSPGKDYTYVIHAQWKENGRTVDRFRTIHVHANMSADVDMTQPQPGDRTEGG